MKKYILVETMASYRMRYVVELNADDPSEWACDTVVMGDAGEVGQKFLGENISDYREVAPEEIRYLAIQDCKAYKTWTAEDMIKILVRGEENND
jgi:hypothetical protein